LWNVSPALLYDVTFSALAVYIGKHPETDGDGTSRDDARHVTVRRSRDWLYY